MYSISVAKITNVQQEREIIMKTFIRTHAMTAAGSVKNLSQIYFYHSAEIRLLKGKFALFYLQLT